MEDPLSRTGLSDGMWVNPLPIDDGGRRQDSCTAYIMPLMRAGGACADNLRLIQSATVSRVVVEGGRAVGVQYIKTDAPEGQQDRDISVVNEVISAAGPYASPRLLQLSGIGPATVLNELGVDVTLDLPVGQNTMVRSPQACAEQCRVLFPRACTSRRAQESSGSHAQSSELVQLHASAGQ